MTTTTATTPNLSWIANYIWGIADDVLRDVYVRGKYRDVILPMTVLRRLDAVLEPTKQAVLDMKAWLDRSRDRRAERNAAGCGWPGVLQHLAVHPERPPKARASQPAAQEPTSRTTSTGSRPTCRTSSTTSSSATRSRSSPGPTPWAR